MMPYLGKSLLSAILVTAFAFTSALSAEETSGGQLSEEQELAIKQELSKYAVLGQQQILHLTQQAIEDYSGTLTDPVPNMPSAWMLLEDGTTIKRIDLDGQAEEAPAQLRILMYRAALKSVARRGKIHATAILYTGKLREDSEDEALVIEYEHRLGIAGNKVIPYQIENGKVAYGEPVTSEKPFQIFYDSRADTTGNAN
ncbi:hypothetical protein [Marinobacter sp. 2_MG-2023]|uniref:hypothetical protein n=1 Tax=Marinobacter sp. 2_MG-2023 TaxID=3062679 RepID=UPI0026E23FCE|nr:hypothetical protein [Marinobacter sp. 2_MG-2023]MDO6442470.1 hypothetical protein [Marinobacter sp. 2_MG-2023]